VNVVRHDHVTTHGNPVLEFSSLTENAKLAVNFRIGQYPLPFVTIEGHKEKRFKVCEYLNARWPSRIARSAHLVSVI
jgi:uncharacterized protein YqjF (DUF2071 family)